jgi:hypothetical protein
MIVDSRAMWTGAWNQILLINMKNSPKQISAIVFAFQWQNPTEDFMRRWVLTFSINVIEICDKKKFVYLFVSLASCGHPWLV